MPAPEISPQPRDHISGEMDRSAEDIHAGRVSDVRDTQARIRAKIEAYEREHASEATHGMR